MKCVQRDKQHQKWLGYFKVNPFGVTDLYSFIKYLILQDVAKAKAFLPFLQRAGKMEGVVEFVASGSRLRLYIPRETCIVTFLLSGTMHI